MSVPALSHANDLLAAYEAAARNDTTLRAAQYARDAALQSQPKARALLLPSLTGSYNYTLNKADATVSYADTTTGVTTPLSRKIDGTDKVLAVTLNQPLFNLESWYRLRQADEKVALALLNYRSSEQALLLRVSEAYFGVLGSADRQRGARAEQEALARQLDLAKQHLQLGVSSLIDVQEVQARYDLSVVDALEAEQAVSDARENLQKITRETQQPDHDQSVHVVPLTPAEAAAPAPARPLATLRDGASLPLAAVGEVSQWVGHAQIDRPEVLQALLNFRIADRGVDIAKAQRWPTVKAQVQYTDSNTESSSFPYQLNGTSYGVGVSLPLFSGGGVQADVREAVATRGQRQAEYEGALREADNAIRKAYQATVIGAARVRAYQQAVASSNGALDASQTGLEIGTRSAIDVLNARQQRYDAEQKYEQSRYDYLLALLRLKSAAGALKVEDLSAIDALLVSN